MLVQRFLPTQTSQGETTGRQVDSRGSDGEVDGVDGRGMSACRDELKSSSRAKETSILSQDVDRALQWPSIEFDAVRGGAGERTSRRTTKGIDVVSSLVYFLSVDFGMG